MATIERKSATIKIDPEVNVAILSAEKLKRLKGESELTKEEAMGIMVEERFALDKALHKKGWTFDELINFLKSKA